MAAGREAVVARHDPPPDEQIEMPVAVPVARHGAGATLRKTREGQRVPVEMSTAVVQVEAVLEGGVVLLELVAAAHDVEIGMPIPIGVEEHRVDVLTQTVGLKRALRARAERAVARSEERRVGEECRRGWVPYQLRRDA